MAKEDLLEHAKSTEDFYALLGVQFESSESDIRRAYRKTALKYHPDKLGAAFDPEKFHLLQVANDVLSDPAAKAIYDQGRQAKQQKAKKDALFEGERKRMKEELERRERDGLTAFGGPSAAGMKRERESGAQQAVDLARLREAGKRRRLAEEEKRRAAGLDTPSKMTPVASPAPTAASGPTPVKERRYSPTAEEEAAEEDEVARLERRILEARAAKELKRAEKKARKSGVYVPAESPAASVASPVVRAAAAGKGFASSPSVPPPAQSARAKDGAGGGFAATMERLREAERRRLEEQIRQEEGEI